MALAIVREKELGSITNLYVTPVTRIEFLIGKQIPYIGVAMANFALMFLMALFVFRVPLKGSFLMLLLGALIYVTTTTAYGMVISAFARTQIAALFGTAIMTVLPASQFAGMMMPVSSLSPTAQIMGRAFPMTYFVPISVGTFTKGLGFADLAARSLSLLSSFRLSRSSAFCSCANRNARRRRCGRLQTYSGSAPRNCAVSCTISCCSGSSSMPSRSAIMAQAGSYSQEVHNASVAVVDEDHSELSRRIAHAFLLPYFQPPQTDCRARHRPADEFAEIYLRDRHPAEF